MARVIKYILNMAGLVWMGAMAFVAYGLIVLPVERSNAMPVIWSTVRNLALLYLIFLVVAACVNWFVQRRFERREATMELLMITVAEVLFLAAVTAYASYDYYLHSTH